MRSAWAFGAALVLLARVVGAEPLKGTLRVERAAGAEACPSADKLRAEVEALAGAPILSGEPEPDRVNIVVTVAPAKLGFTATVRTTGVRPGERTIEDSGPGCEVLTRGLVVILALLVDAPLEGPRPAPVQPRRAPQPQPVFILPEVPTLRPEERATRVPPLIGSIGPVYATGLLPSDAAGLALAFEGYLPLVSFGGSIVWLPRDVREVRDHEAIDSYVGARARVCARQPDLDQYGIAACLRFGAGRRASELVRARSDRTLDESDGGYVAPGGELEISRRIVGPLGVYANFGLDFAVVNDPVTLETAEVTVPSDDPGLSFDMGVGLRFWLEPETPAAP